jgi:type IV secretory pathway VirB10-like protein
LMPDGYSVDLDQFHGLDQAGATGLKDQVNNHYVEIFGASIALGIISGAAEATNANHGYNESGSEAYKAGIEPFAVQRERARPLHQYPTHHHHPRRPPDQGLHHAGHAAACV